MEMKLHVLIVEDSEDDADLVVRELKGAGYSIDSLRVETEAALRSAFEAMRWDLVIGDYNIPGFSGTGALAVIRELDPDVPFIFVSGTIGEDVAVAALKAGGNDYVMKGSLKRLAPAVARELREAEGRRERKRLDEQLRQSQRLESVGRLAGGVAHDFNNLLTVLLGHADFLLASIPSEDPRRVDVQEIVRAAERATALTRQLLAFSRRQMLEIRSLDLNAIVSGMEPMIRRLIGEHIEVHATLATDLGAVRADQGQLEQVLMNLVVNARDAMPDGGRLTIETTNVQFDAEYVRQHPAVPAGPFVMLSVSDTGVGMDEATRARLFEPFFTTKPTGQGTGLGLATVYGIVKQMAGSIWVYSEPGQGSAFKIYFPRTDEVVAAPPPRNEPSSLEGSETLLLVEDDEPLRNLIRIALERFGYTVLEAQDGPAALEVAASGPQIDMLVTDVVMPHLSGSELGAKLSARYPNLAILYMSGYTDDAVIRHGVLEAGRAYLEKPFTPAGLARKIRTILAASRLAPSK